MTAQSALKQERFQSRQGNINALPLTTNGGGISHLFSGEGYTEGEAPSMQSTAFTEVVSRQTTEKVREVEGVLGIATPSGQLKLPMTSRAVLSPDDNLTISFFDQTYTLTLEIVPHRGIMNINVQYVDKPLHVALQCARFFEALATIPGQLFFEAYEVVAQDEVIPHRVPIGELPLSLPESELEGYRDRLRLLEGLYEIFVNTGIEVRYPENTEEEEGLANFNFVLIAIRGGWVAQQITDFATPMPTEVDTLLDELRKEGQVLRAFYFELPNEAYVVFGKEVSLGPSRRYIAAAQLASTQEEIEAWLTQEPEDKVALPLRWEPVDDTPMHIFFEDWPKSSLVSIERQLREFEAAYGTSSERFRQAWEQREAWVQEIQDRNRWLSLIQAHAELTQET